MTFNEAVKIVAGEFDLPESKIWECLKKA